MYVYLILFNLDLATIIWFNPIIKKSLRILLTLFYSDIDDDNDVITKC